MKIHILYNFKNQPWGGGNQFLRALKKEFAKKDVYEENPEKADIVLFNSHHDFDEIFALKKKFKEKIFIHRIDGPIRLIRGEDEGLDKKIYQFNNLIADGIIFQSNWCKEQNKRLFKFSSGYESVIHNAPNSDIFNTINKKAFDPKEKVKLIANSWSSNWRKGFDIYKYLDKNLDFLKYEMTFVGNSPIEFKNIKYIKPVDSEELAKILKQHDVYITASQNDPCSNALIEALSCGLPAVALNDGGHPELIKGGGELFNGKEDIIGKIEKVVQNFHYYQDKISEFSIEKDAQEYYEFTKKIYNDVQGGRRQPKVVNFLAKIKFYKMKFISLAWQIAIKLKYYKNGKR